MWLELTVRKFYTASRKSGCAGTGARPAEGGWRLLVFDRARRSASIDARCKGDRGRSHASLFGRGRAQPSRVPRTEPPCRQRNDPVDTHCASGFLEQVRRVWVNRAPGVNTSVRRAGVNAGSTPSAMCPRGSLDGTGAPVIAHVIVRRHRRFTVTASDFSPAGRVEGCGRFRMLG